MGGRCRADRSVGGEAAIGSGRQGDRCPTVSRRQNGACPSRSASSNLASLPVPTSAVRARQGGLNYRRLAAVRMPRRLARHVQTTHVTVVTSVCYLRDDNEIDAERCRISLREKSPITLLTLDGAGHVVCFDRSRSINSVRSQPRSRNAVASGNRFGDGCIDCPVTESAEQAHHRRRRHGGTMIRA